MYIIILGYLARPVGYLRDGWGFPGLTYSLGAHCCTMVTDFNSFTRVKCNIAQTMSSVFFFCFFLCAVDKNIHRVPFCCRVMDAVLFTFALTCPIIVQLVGKS